jgi:tRNA 2-thiocytidine biosynthesis protein TtcA
MDRKLFPFTTVKASGLADAEGDKAFDDEPCAPPALPAGSIAALKAELLED